MSIMANTSCNVDRMTLERIVARSFVVLGGLFWMVAALAAGRGFVGGNGSIMSATTALLPLALTAAILAIGWFYEYAASAILIAGSSAVVAWGLTAGWEGGVWMLMGTTLLAPMLISSAMFFAAARMQGICTIESASPAAAPIAHEAPVI
jgi:hypothetical protein